MQTKDSQQVIGRFFEALRLLIRQKKIRGKQTFTRRYGVNRWNMNTLEKNPASDMFQAAWLTYLVRDYGVSADWLLTGEGAFFSHNAGGYPAVPCTPEPKRKRGRPRKNQSAEGFDERT